MFSVGGGDVERNISPNLVRALELARTVGAEVYGIVGRDGGYTGKVADAVVVIPPLHPERTTPHTEGLCAVVWHLLVSHPALQRTRHEVGERATGERTLVSDVYRRVAVVGGAGFIGSHLVRTLLDRAGTERVTVYDNFTSGRRWHLDAIAGPRLDVVEGEARDLDALTAALGARPPSCTSRRTPTSPRR